MSKSEWKKFKSKTNQKRNKVRSIRVTPLEDQQLLELANENNSSIVDYILGKTIYSDNHNYLLDNEQILNCYLELNKQGTNLNQATKALNLALKVPNNVQEFSKRINKALLKIENLEKSCNLALQNTAELFYNFNHRREI